MDAATSLGAVVDAVLSTESVRRQLCLSALTPTAAIRKATVKLVAAAVGAPVMVVVAVQAGTAGEAAMSLSTRIRTWVLSTTLTSGRRIITRCRLPRASIVAGGVAVAAVAHGEVGDEGLLRQVVPLRPVPDIRRVSFFKGDGVFTFLLFFRILDYQLLNGKGGVGSQTWLVGSSGMRLTI